MRAAIATAAAGAVLLGAGAAWLVYRATAPAEPAGTSLPGPAAEVPRAAPPTAVEVLDRTESRRLAELEEQRSRFRTLRDAFASARPSPAAQARIEPALQALWPGPGAPRWASACRGLVCRLEVQAPMGSWRPALEGSVAMREVIDRAAFDPDGAEAAAFLTLPASASARPRDDLLAALEKELRESSDLRDCLAGSPEAGTLEVELALDASGFTYRAGGDLDTGVIRCASDAVDGIIGLARVPDHAKSSSRRLVLRARGK